ncbi:conserved protein, unknown function, partial [Hepatocystis sp. ex Piliocolobus tephrosceles]
MQKEKKINKTNKINRLANKQRKKQANIHTKKHTSKMDKETVNTLLNNAVSELETSRKLLESKLNSEEQNIKGGNRKKKNKPAKYNEIFDSINKKIECYKKLAKELNKLETKSDEASKKKKKKKENFFEVCKTKINKQNLSKLKKKITVGYTTEGNAININNEELSKCFLDYDRVYKNKNNDNNSTNNKYNKHNNSNNNNDNITEIINETSENAYFSDELSCSSSSVISLNSFVKNEQIERKNKNKKTYIKHKYYNNAFINHRLNACSDCSSSSSFSWYDETYDDMFYYTNFVKEDKNLKKNTNFLNILNNKKQDKKNKIQNSKQHSKQHSEKESDEKTFTDFKTKVEKENCLFYDYIYFKYNNNEKKKKEIHPVFVNNVNNKKKIYNLSKLNRSNTRNMYKNTLNKYELDKNLFSYEKTKYLDSLENNTEQEQHDELDEELFVEKRNLNHIDYHEHDFETFKKKKFDEDEINYSINRTIYQLNKIHDTKDENNNKINYSDNISNFIRKNKDCLKREIDFTFKNMCIEEKIQLKLKILGTDGKQIK